MFLILHLLEKIPQYSNPGRSLLDNDKESSQNCIEILMNILFQETTTKTACRRLDMV